MDPVFIPPENEHVALWRYMDLAKYVALLNTGSLYFARADKFEDRFEGASTKANVQARPEWYADIRITAPGHDPLSLIPRLNANSRAWTYISCWHANEVESAAMWSLYARSNEAIAVRTTFARLRDQLPKDANIGVVHYIDYDSDLIPESNLHYRFLRKRRSFEHEREVRAIIMDPIIEDGKMIPARENPAHGKMVPVNLAALIEGAYVAPTAPRWFLDVAEAVTQRFGYQFPVTRSSLDADPVY